LETANAEEEAGGTRLQIDGKTCLLQVNTDHGLDVFSLEYDARASICISSS
jgi:hypothetical protein